RQGLEAAAERARRRAGAAGPGPRARRRALLAAEGGARRLRGPPGGRPLPLRRRLHRRRPDRVPVPQVRAPARPGRRRALPPRPHGAPAAVLPPSPRRMDRARRRAPSRIAIAYSTLLSMPRLFEVQAPLARNASVAATEVIREAIVDGRLEPGQRLKEEELARELGISRTPIREALLILQSEGLVEATPNRGATVRTHTPE